MGSPHYFPPTPRHPPPHTTIRHTMCHLLCGGLGGIWGALFIFIFGALRSKDAIKISAPRAARQGLISTGRNRRGMGSPSISAPTPLPPPPPPPTIPSTMCHLLYGRISFPFLFLFL